MALGKINIWAEQGGNLVTTGSFKSTTTEQGSFPGCTVTVYIAGTTSLATIYSDSIGTAKANPFTSGTDADASFFVAPGLYDIKFSGTGISTPFTVSSVSSGISYVNAPTDGTDASTAIQAAITATPSGGTLIFSSGSTYTINSEIFINKPITLDLTGATLQMPAQASMFTTSHVYGRYLLSIRSSDVTILNGTFDGNSRNNVLGGGLRLDGTHSVGLVNVGFYGADIIGVPVTGTVTPVDLNNILITGTTFYDSAASGLDGYMQNNTGVFATDKHVYNYRVIGCHFERCQGVQLVSMDTVGAVFTGNTHKLPYFAAFQTYYDTFGTVYEDNTIHVSSSSITDWSLVDTTLKGTSSSGPQYLIFGGQIRLGRTESRPNTGVMCRNNFIYGGTILAIAGLQYSTIEGNTVYNSEQCGINYQDSAGLLNIGNSIKNNKVIGSDQPNYYLSDSGNKVLVEDNESWGGCVNVLNNNFGARQLNSGILIWNDTYILRRNLARKIGTTPTFGVTAMVLAAKALELRDNDFRGSGNTTDVIISAGTSPPVASGVQFISDPQIWTFSADALADQALVDTAPIAANGILTAQAGAELAIYAITSSGGVTTVVKAAGTANAVNTNTDTNLCVYPSGNQVMISNRLGASKAVKVHFVYR